MASMFVGRNEQIKRFEEHFDSIDHEAPVCVIASGLRGIGRRTLLRHCFVKASVWQQTYSPPLIEINSSESIEDFILKTADLGISDVDISSLALSTLPVDEKVQIAASILADFQKAREFLMVLDHGGIVIPTHDLAPWFASLVAKLSTSKSVAVCVASSFRPAPAVIRKIPTVFHLEVPELERAERTGLFKRHSELLELELTNENLKFFAGLLNGFPEQAEFAAKLIKSEGLHAAKAASADIADFNTEKVALLIKDIEGNSVAFELLCLLAEFEFISLDFLQSIVDDTTETKKCLRDFVGRAICERMGANGEYLRMNDAIRNYVSRRRLGLAERFKTRMRNGVEEFLKSPKGVDSDVSRVLISLKQALIQGLPVPDEMLIPSHFLKTMKELYDRHQRYREVIILADRILQNSATLDQEILREIRYFMCLALARTRNKRCLQEITSFNGLDHAFLLGFYYRCMGRFEDALARFKEALQYAPSLAKVRRELVNVYMRLGLYEEALAHARANYERDQTNPFHIQAYLRCITHTPRTSESRALMEILCEKLGGIQSEMAREMALIARAETAAFGDKKISLALSILSEAKALFPQSPYSRISELEILEATGDIKGLEIRLNEEEQLIATDSPYRTSLVRLRCLLLARKGHKSQALASLEASDLPDISKSRIRARIQSL